jgi:hypothetical protein
MRNYVFNALALATEGDTMYLKLLVMICCTKFCCGKSARAEQVKLP